MPMTLITGLPGTFKSCSAVELLIKFATDDAYKERPRFVLGITDLRPDLAEIITVDQFKDWKSLPVGAVVVVDEVQKVMPARRSGDPPQFIRDMSEHRHRGIEFIFITQKPAMVDKYVRDLVDRHLHHIRKYGSMWAERWEFDHCEDEPLRKGARALATGKEFVKASKEAMESYTSSQLHTIKRKLPRSLKVAVLLLVAIPAAFYFAYHKVSSLSDQHATELKKEDQGSKGLAAMTGASPLPPSMGKGGDDRHHVLTRDEWIARFTPRVAGMPWSAPAYDDRQVQGTPELYCVIFAVGEPDEHCRCNTEQGTRAMVPDNMCKAMARDGTYNPYRKAHELPGGPQRGRDEATDPQGIEVASASQPGVTHTLRPGSSAPVVRSSTN